MTQKKTVEVVIAQQRLSLKTDQDPARVQQLADLVNNRITTILPFNQPLSHQVLLLLAMTLADELLKAQEEGSTLKAEVKQRSQAILTQLEREFSL
jgi:cell division protein ZapA (FtsZ GTPase activity inhibitor)